MSMDATIMYSNTNAANENLNMEDQWLMLTERLLPYPPNVMSMAMFSTKSSTPTNTLNSRNIRPNVFNPDER